VPVVAQVCPDEYADLAATHVSRLQRTSIRRGEWGAVSAAHPLATEASRDIFRLGGNAVDAAIAAQAVICVVMPQAAGLGGDLLALIHRNGIVSAVNGNGRSPEEAPVGTTLDGGSSVTVPGLVPAWVSAHERFGLLGMSNILRPAADLAGRGITVDQVLRTGLERQAHRLALYGAEGWSLLQKAKGDLWRQPELELLLRGIGESGVNGYYTDVAIPAMARAAQRNGGTLHIDDFRKHRTLITSPISVGWGDRTLLVQPPAAQGVLLAMAAQWLNGHDRFSDDNRQHVLVELINSVFAHRDEAKRGASLLALPLEVDVLRAQHRGGPRSYLHTAAVSTADAGGLVVSSLVSMFDDFGSAVFVPELGIVLNNRAAGFTNGENTWAPRTFPVHTLAPAMLTGLGGEVLALATPGADGQVQTLLQILSHLRWQGEDLASALTAPRWRSQDGSLVVEDDHPDMEELIARGHHLTPLPSGDDIFGAVAVAGYQDKNPFAASDWRRQVTTGIL